MVQPNSECANFCYWILNVSWQPLTSSQSSLITTVYNAALAFTTVTDQQWKDFNMVTTWRKKYYDAWSELATSYCAQSELYFAQMTVQPTASFKTAVDTFIRACITNGDWNYIDSFHLFATQLQQHAWIDMRYPTHALVTEVNSPTWSALQGYKSNGTTSYVNTQFNPTVNGVTISQDNMSVFAYVRDNIDENKYQFGATSATTTFNLRARNSNLASFGLNSGGSVSGANTDSRGFFQGIRSGPTTNAVYKNGAQIGTGANASLTPPNLNLYACCLNSSGVAGSFSNTQVSIVGVASKLISPSNFYTNVQALATSLGFNV